LSDPIGEKKLIPHDTHFIFAIILLKNYTIY
jgi:hypothetical protein